MANSTVYPYGTGGSLPSSIGIINDLATGGADKALSAEMGKTLEGEISQLGLEVGDVPEVNIPYNITNWINGGLTSGTTIAYQTNPSRLIATCPVNGGDIFKFACEGTYTVSIRLISKEQFDPPTTIADLNTTTDVLIKTDTWSASGELVAPAGVKSAVILLRNGSARISPSEASNFSAWTTGVISLADKVDDLIPLNEEKTESRNPNNWVKGSLDGNFDYIFAANRLIGTMAIPGGYASKIALSANTGYEISLRLVSKAKFDDPLDINIDSEDVLNSSSWSTAGELAIPSGVKSAIVIIKRTDSANLSADEGANVSFTIAFDGIQQQVEALYNAVSPASVSGYYEGEPLYIGKKTPYHQNVWKTFALSVYAQAMAIYGDYVVFFHGNNGGGSLWQISTATKIADITWPDGGFSTPHGNVICFGREFASGNSDLPLLYVSQWDGEGGCFVYNLQADGTITLVQTIMVSGMSADVYGSDLGDWIVDVNAGEIYSCKYHLSSSTTEAGNSDHICKFKLPTLADGSAITFTPSDILDSFILPFTPISQDKKIWNGLLFIAAGNTTSISSCKIYVADLSRKAITSKIDLSIYRDEPEGIEIIPEGIVLGYGFQPQTFYLITTV